VITSLCPKRFPKEKKTWGSLGPKQRITESAELSDTSLDGAGLERAARYNTVIPKKREKGRNLALSYIVNSKFPGGRLAILLARKQ